MSKEKVLTSGKTMPKMKANIENLESLVQDCENLKNVALSFMRETELGLDRVMQDVHNSMSAIYSANEIKEENRSEDIESFIQLKVATILQGCNAIKSNAEAILKGNISAIKDRMNK